MPDRNDRLNGGTHGFDRKVIVAEGPSLTTKGTKDTGPRQRPPGGKGIEPPRAMGDALERTGPSADDADPHRRGGPVAELLREPVQFPNELRFARTRSACVHLAVACALLACLWLTPALADGTPVPETPAARSAYDVLEQLMADTARVSREVELWNAKAKLEESPPG